jgi:DNA polymerase-1
VEGARERGYVETLMGRRRFIPELKSGNWNVRQFGERVAQNTPIQGSAADLIKRATIDLQATLDERFPDSLILLQVHDELLLEVPEAQVEAVSGLVAERMEGALRLDVPLVVDVGVGPDWYNCKG